MYHIQWKKEKFGLAIIGLSLVGVVFVYPALPAELPMHWNLQGQIDSWVKKSWLTVAWMPLLVATIYFLMLLIPYLDPRQERYAEFIRPYRSIRNGLTLYLALIIAIVLVAAFHPTWPVPKLITCALSLLFMVIGNYLGKIRPNWFVGIRLPWTLDNEEVWNRTHRLAGKLFVITGGLGLFSLCLPEVGMAMVFFGSVFSTLTITFLYSFRLHNKLKG